MYGVQGEQWKLKVVAMDTITQSCFFPWKTECWRQFFIISFNGCQLHKVQNDEVLSRSVDFPYESISCSMLKGTPVFLVQDLDQVKGTSIQCLKACQSTAPLPPNKLHTSLSFFFSRLLELNQRQFNPTTTCLCGSVSILCRSSRALRLWPLQSPPYFKPGNHKGANREARPEWRHA